MKNNLLNWLIGSIANTFNGFGNNSAGGGGGLGAIAGFAGKLLGGFHEGGSFKVDGNSGVDKNLIAFMASKGERVTVETKEQQRGDEVIAGFAGKLLRGFNSGGSFMVGGQSGMDRNLVAFKASKGERVTVETKEQQRQGGADTYIITSNFDGAVIHAASEEDLRRVEQAARDGAVAEMHKRKRMGAY